MKKNDGLSAIIREERREAHKREMIRRKARRMRDLTSHMGLVPLEELERGAELRAIRARVRNATGEPQR